MGARRVLERNRLARRRSRVARSLAKHRQQAGQIALSAAEREALADRAVAEAVDSAEAQIARFDGGISAAAVKAISALPPGPARAFEAKRWARRAHDENGELVTLLYEALTDEEMLAALELQQAYRELADTPRSRRGSAPRPRVMQ